MPDLRGLFLRGHGGESAALGIKQNDAMRNLTGSFAVYSYAQYADFPGVIKGTHLGGWFHHGYGSTYEQGYRYDLDFSRQINTANENRPQNMAVRYLIRARP